MPNQTPNPKPSLQLYLFLFTQVMNDSDFESPICAKRKRRHPRNMVRARSKASSFLEYIFKHLLCQSLGKCSYKNILCHLT